MKVRTNKVQYTLFYDAIAEDFSVFALHFAKVEERNMAYSLPLLDYGIVATYATQKKEHDYLLYVCVQNSKNGIYRYYDALQNKNVEPFARERVSIIADKEIDYVLMQLLLGYLAIIDVDEDSECANYYGKLYASKVPYMPDAYTTMDVHKNTIVFPRVEYTKDNTLFIAVESWMPFIFNLDHKKEKMKRYKAVLSWDYFSDAIKRVPWEEVTKRVNQWKKITGPKRKEAEKELFANWYVQGVPNHKVKNSIPFGTITRQKKFEDKLSIRKRLIESIEDELSKYLVIKPVVENMKKYVSYKKAEQEKDRARKLQVAILTIAQKGLVIVYKTEEQRQLAVKIKEVLLNDPVFAEMKQEYIHIQKETNIHSWNLSIVFPKSSDVYLDETGKYCVELDDYTGLSAGCIQHYVKNDKKESPKDIKNYMLVCLLELLAKDALLQCQLPLCMCPQKDITVVKRIKDKEHNTWNVFSLQITKKGKIMDKMAFEDDGIFTEEEQFAIHDKFSDIDIQNEGIKTIRPVEGLFKMENGPYCAIYKTTKFPMPNYDKLLEDLQKNVGKDLTKARCYEYMDKYLSMNPEFELVFAYVKEELSQDGSLSIGVSQWEALLRKACSKKNNNKLSKGKKLIGFSEFVAEKSQGQILLVLNVKTEKNGNPYDMDHLTGIVYKESPKFYSYYVGYRTLQNLNNTSTIDKASPIRMVEKDDSYTFDDYASLLDVSWVRAGTLEATVLPFPFKILNEYMKTALPELQKQNVVEEE